MTNEQRCERHFLGWERPAIDAAAAWLFDRAVSASPGEARPGGEADFEGRLIVVPGGRARRLLTGALVDEASSRSVALTPPLIVTPGELPGALLGPAGAGASAITRRLAWTAALRDEPDDALASLIGPGFDADDERGWRRVASWLEPVSTGLAGVGLRFGDIPRRAGAALPTSEATRWAALDAAQRRYESLLADAGLVDDALATMEQVRRDGSHGEGVTERGDVEDVHVTLFGVPDLEWVVREALRLRASHVDALVFAPAEMHDRFDSLGCVKTAAWNEAAVEIDEADIVFVDRERAQAEAVLATIATRAGGDDVDAGEVVIGVTDGTLLAQVQQRAAVDADVVIRSPTGALASSTGPGRVLKALATFTADRSFDALVRLTREPDVERALLRRSVGVDREQAPDLSDEREREAAAAREHSDDDDVMIAESAADGRASDDDAISPSEPRVEWWLTRLDEAATEHMLGESLEAPTAMRPRAAAALRFVSRTLGAIFGDLITQPGMRRSLDEWTERVRAAFVTLYDGVELDPAADDDARTIATLERLQTAFEQAASRAACAVCPAVDAPFVLSLLSDTMETERIPEPPRRDAIDALGWLELPVDPAPRCVVVGMVEGRVPASVTHDPLLPDGLRRAAGMRTNDDRLARDAFLLASIAGSRDAAFVAPRASDEGDPLTPSRLLFRVNGERLARRVQRFTGGEHGPRVDAFVASPRLASRIRSGDACLFRPELRASDDFAPPLSMSVTDFDVFLRSPARWYLERYLRLNDVGEPPREMNAMVYGSFAHAVLEAFGRDPETASLHDEAAIADALRALTRAQLEATFGGSPPAAVAVQAALLEHRFAMYAPHEARRRRDGWRIAHVEWSSGDADTSPTFDVDGEPMALRGKVDRIERRDDGSWALIDFKTGAVRDAEKSHRRRGRWVRLQLPLYGVLTREFAAAEGLDVDRVEFAYGGLPTKMGEAAWSVAPWDATDLAEAQDAACDVVRRIRSIAPGDTIELGDDPPTDGALGFMTGERFEGGPAILDEESVSDEAAAAGEVA